MPVSSPHSCDAQCSVLYEIKQIQAEHLSTCSHQTPEWGDGVYSVTGLRMHSMSKPETDGLHGKTTMTGSGTTVGTRPPK